MFSAVRNERRRRAVRVVNRANDVEWKFRAVGQGYASGLAGIASDYGVNV